MDYSIEPFRISHDFFHGKAIFMRTALFWAIGLSFAAVMSVFAIDGEIAKAYPIVSQYNQGRAPSERIFKRGDKNIYAILHFGPNTYTDREWGYGDEDPKNFNPTQFDAEQIVKAAKDGGITGIIIVCKHHDGLCLWPTKTTEHNITKTSFRDGKGDYVKEMADACHKYGLDVGFYVSPWDRNSPYYGKPEYIDIYRAQLREVLSNYGPAFEVFVDGANGGDGYYGGARERRNIDHRVYYDWANSWSIIRELQPDACIWSDVGPDVKFVGNEQGMCDADGFASFSPKAPGIGEAMPGYCRFNESNRGHQDGVFFIPGDCDVALRPGWFYHPAEDNAVKSVRQLVNIYLHSVGAGSFLNIGLAPDKRGLLHENDVKRLKEFKTAVDSLFADQIFEKDLKLEQNQGIVTFESPHKINLVKLAEDLRATKGEAVSAYSIDLRVNGQWVTVANGKGVGLNRLKPFQPKTADALRIRVTASSIPVPSLKISGYFAPDDLVGNGLPVRNNDIRNRREYQRLAPGKLSGKSIECDIPSDINKISGIVFTPLDGIPAGTPDRCKVEVFLDGKWTALPETEFSNIKANPIPQLIHMETTKATRIRITAVHCLEEATELAFAEIGIMK